MAGRPGFFGGSRGGDPQARDGDYGDGSGGPFGERPFLRIGDRDEGRPQGGFGSGFDPVWGTLGGPAGAGADDWLTRPQEAADGVAVIIEIMGNGFQISGAIRTGQFDRLSDWLNVKSGFIQVHDAMHVGPGQSGGPDPNCTHGPLWVRLDQIVLVAERTPIKTNRPGAVIVQKQRRRVSIVTPGYNLRGSIHIHAHGSMANLLEAPEPHFLPLSDVTVEWLSEAGIAARYPFALANRQQLVTVRDEPRVAAGDSTNARVPGDESPLDRGCGAA